MATVCPACFEVGRRKRSAFARRSRLSPGWGVAPRRPVTRSVSRSTSCASRFRFPERRSPRPASCAGGATWTRSLLKFRLAMRPMRRLRDLPRCSVCDPDPAGRLPPSARHRTGSRSPESKRTDAPRHRRDGRNGPSRLPTAGPGPDGWRVEVGSSKIASQFVVLRRPAHADAGNKKSRHRCPFRAARCAARRLPSHRVRRARSQGDIGTRLP